MFRELYERKELSFSLAFFFEDLCEGLRLSPFWWSYHSMPERGKSLDY